MLMQFTKTRHQKGFTMIELMIVIAIVGILAAIAIPNFIRYRDNAKDAAALSDAKSAYTAALAYMTTFPLKQWTEVNKDMLYAGGFRETRDITVVKPTGDASVITATPTGGTHYYTVDELGHVSELDK